MVVDNTGGKITLHKLDVYNRITRGRWKKYPDGYCIRCEVHKPASGRLVVTNYTSNVGYDDPEVARRHLQKLAEGITGAEFYPAFHRSSQQPMGCERFRPLRR